MSVWQQLYETYNEHYNEIGKVRKRWTEQTFTLLPISHTTQTAHITVHITPEGEFHLAELIPKGQGNTLIPCTEDSASRSGISASSFPHPLHDKLPHVAGDFEKYFGVSKKENPYGIFIRNLKDWSESPYSFDQLKSIYNYLKKGKLVEDLLKEKLIEKNDDESVKWVAAKGFEEPMDGPKSIFIRFTVRSSEELLNETWWNVNFYTSFIKYYESKKQKKKSICYVTSNYNDISIKHPNKIRNSGDMTKLISSNDSRDFTFRGRFSEQSEVMGISYEVSQKAHNALKWLIQKQGTKIKQRIFLVWGNRSATVPDVIDSTFSLSNFFQDNLKEIEVDTNEEGAISFSESLFGYKRKLPKQRINIVVLDSATDNQGRLAILYYRSFDQEHYFERLERWHTHNLWEYTYKDQEGKIRTFTGAPALKDIATMAYGTHANDQLIKATVERLLPSVVDERRIPDDIRRCLMQRASNPIGMEKWEWEKTLQIACGVINKKEGMNVALDRESTDRDYLFGRLLALADYLERKALKEQRENRATNAIRYMNAFSQKPARTWLTIQSALQPYQAKLGGKITYINSQIDEVGSQIDPKDFTNKPLSERYLLGFYSQRHDLYQKKEVVSPSEEESVEV
ncbi:MULTISPECIES: type I-C CRISPR-associated protein Cas8c/Csd1 [unclassified Exiguobacterium]|uniref:type I-C CRISPR-associated protein Cas8c/Csd1 n=1 Tax=unclassified Exiguobacterium TaxID=2644629 RepID=UPI001BECFD5E|nr:MULTISPECIES: type I-C CRISPR-associated protein Cas8c/Csd1 [unclassified Exiguobacterium]